MELSNAPVARGNTQGYIVKYSFVNYSVTMFKRLIEEMLDTGMTEDDIGQRVGSSQASINRIKSGSQNPKYDLGAALVALHKEVVMPPAAVEDRRVKEQRAGERRARDLFASVVPAEGEKAA